MEELEERKAIGPDGVSGFILKDCRNQLVRLVYDIIKCSISTGKPSAIMGKRKGYEDINSVSGYWLCKDLLKTNLSHYFLGSTPERLEKIRNELIQNGSG